ncbi:hypothetical protein Hanom_Chr13g01206391 [Helianthus anomalus]
MLENRKISKDFDKLKRRIKDSDERNSKTPKSENGRINLKLNSYTSASFVLQHIIPKPGEDVYSDGTRVGYHKVPPPMRNNFTKKQSGLVNESFSSEKSDAEKLPDNIDVTFNSQSGEGSIESEVVKDVVEKSKPKSQNNLEDEPTLVMYKMNGSDKLYSDKEFPIENVNVDKLKKVFKLVEFDVSEVNGLSSTKRF